MKRLLRSSTFVLAVAFSLAACCAAPPAALAHAVLRKSIPEVHAVIDHRLDGGRFPIVLTFNSRIDAAHSSLSLYAAATGKRIPLTLDRKTPGPANVLRGIGTPITAGHYSLHWQVVAGDGHITRGSIPFDVR